MSLSDCLSLSPQSSELLALTYGALVAQLVEDYEDPAAINEQLEKMGYNIGMRLIEEFLAKTAELPLWSKTPCADFKEAMDVVAKVGFKMFLGINVDTRWMSDTEVALVFRDELPLNEFVELPESLSALNYSNIVCGVVRGSLEMVQFKVSCRFGSDTLQGADVSEVLVQLTELLADIPPNDED